MTDKIEVFLPIIDSSIEEYIDDFFRSKNRDVMEAINHKNFLVHKSSVDDFIEENFPNSSPQDKIDLKKVKFDEYKKQAFTIIRRNADDSYKLDLVLSKKNDNQVCEIQLISYKMDVYFKPELFFETFLKSGFFYLISGLAIGPLPISVFLAKTIFDKKETLSEDQIKNYLLYKLAKYAESNVNNISIKYSN